MRSWDDDQGQAAGGLWNRSREWWWRRRLGIADWLYALLPLPFSGIMQFGSVAGGGIGLFGIPHNFVINSLASLNFLAGLVAGFVLVVIPVMWAGTTVLLRRTAPEWLLVTGFVLLLLFANFVPAAIALYSYAVYHSNRRRLVIWFAVYALAMVIAYQANPFGQVFLIGMLLVVPMTIGLWVGTRRQLIDRLHERAERLEREQHMLADQAITAERTRIAREMHDVVAHRVSLMVLHAGGLEVSSDDPRTIEAAGLVRTTGREALTELRSILGVLRDDTAAAPTAPQPVLADLERLVGEWRAAGMPIHREDTGQLRPLPTGVQRTAYRIVQEGLTNAAKHAPGAAVALRLHYGAGQLELEVSNDPAPAPTAPMPRSGFGLTGLHERVVLSGGNLSAGVCAEGGWRLRAILRTDTPPGTEEVPDGDSHAPGR